MSKTEIFYFSGTGNSLAVAKDIAARLNAKLTHIASLADVGEYCSDADALGFVFPLYDFKAPELVNEAVRKINALNEKYVFALATYGIAPLKSLARLRQTVEASGGKMAAGFAVQMPHNGIGSGTQREKQRLAIQQNWIKHCDGVCKTILNKRQNDGENIRFSGSMLRIVKMMPTLMRFIGRVIRKGVDSLTLVVDETCDGCEICEIVCPVGNIKIADKKPVWADHCAGCFACYHWCPKGAISLGGFDAKVKAYHHPQVSLQDMMRK